MLKRIDLSNTRHQLVIGFLLNLFFLGFLYCYDASYKNAQAPLGEFKNNIWSCSDAPSYIKPAFNFLDYGIFGEQNQPDYFRTIGYPSILSFFIYLFGNYWVLALQIFQALLFAFIYPLVTNTVKILFDNPSGKFIKLLFISLCLSGTYFTRTPVILTDTLFTLLFMAGFYYGLKTYQTAKKTDVLWFLFFITIASLVRPTLGLFPFLNLIMAYWVINRKKISFKTVALKSIALSLVFLFTVNISSIRNYANHSFFSPSSVIGINAFHYLAKKILVMEGQEDKFEAYAREIEETKDISEKTSLRKKVMFESIVKYPVSTIKVLTDNTINVLLAENLLSNTSNFFDFNWKKQTNSCYSYKTTKILYYLTYLFMLVYAILWAAFFIKLFLLFRSKEYATFFMIGFLFVMFIIPAILTGDGGGRFRLPFEHILFIFSLDLIYNKRYKTIRS